MPSGAPSALDPVAAEVARAARRLGEVYRLGLRFEPERFLIDACAARELFSELRPRSGLLVLEEAQELHCALYIDPADAENADTIAEETSHLVCVAWHAAQERRVSSLALELQSEVDRYLLARLDGREALRHFRDFAWADWLGPAERERYATAHHAAQRYCAALEERYPCREHTGALLAELRHYYRADQERKLRAGLDAPLRA